MKKLFTSDFTKRQVHKYVLLYDRGILIVWRKDGAVFGKPFPVIRLLVISHSHTTEG